MRFFKAAIVFAAITISTVANAQPRPGGGGSTPAPASAPTTTSGLITVYDANQIAQLFTAAGFPSSVSVGSDKVPYVQVQFWPNTVAGVAPGYCNKDGTNCNAYKLIAIISNETSIGDAWTDAWNGYYYFVRAYKDGTDLYFTWDILLAPGVTPDYIKTTASIFKSIVDDSTNFKP